MIRIEKSPFFVVISLFLAILPAPVAAQDTFVPTHGKAACEFWSGTDCARVGRPRTRIVRVPVTTIKPMVHVPEHLVPLHTRRPEVRGWRRDHDWRDRDRPIRMAPMVGHDGPRCWPTPYHAASDEKVALDAELQAIKRWEDQVAIFRGKLMLDWKNATDKQVQCFKSSADTRATDRVVGAVKGAVRRIGDAVKGRERDEDDVTTASHEQCIVQARPCRAPTEEKKDRDAERRDE